MNLFKFFRNQRGFTLLEIAVVLVVITILAGAAMPTVAKKVRIAYAQKTAQEIGIIQDASKNYYIDNKGWPASISTLQTAGYLSSVWSGNNPWGNAYAVSEGATPQTFKVSTTMPSELTGAATALLPSSSAVGGVVTSEIPVPGEEPSLESLVHRYSDDETLRTMTQRLITPAIVGETGSSAWGLNLSDTADPDSGLAAGEGRIGSFAVGTTDNSLAKLTVSGTADQIQQIVRAYSAQTANLAEWQNSAGTVLASIDPSGNPTIQNTAPQLVLQDTTTGAKYLIAKVTGNKAYLQEIGGTDGSLVTLDLANARTGFGTDSPDSRVTIKGAGATSDTSSFDITDSDENSILYVRDDGNVGIGTTGPKEKLHILDGTANIIAGAGYSGHGGIGFGSSFSKNNYSLLGEGTHTYLNAPSGGMILFRENNVTKMVLKSGNLGIGTNDPKAKLDIEGSIQFGTGTTTATLKGIYDSGWFAISGNHTYIQYHGLAAYPKIIQVYVAQKSDGSGWCVPAETILDPANHETSFVEVASNFIRIRTQAYVAYFRDKNGNQVKVTNGYCRVVAIA